MRYLSACSFALNIGWEMEWHGKSRRYEYKTSGA